MNRNFYPDLIKNKPLAEQDDEEKLPKKIKGSAIFANNTFNNCIFIFNFAGPEDREDEDGF